MKLIPAFIILLLSSIDAWAEKPEVVDLGDGKYKLGLVTFDEKTRHISFPAELNQSEGVVEYAIVHENGKIHEALLITKTSAFHLNVALKLLRYESSPELFPILNEDYENTGVYPKVSKEQQAAARLQVLVSWEADGKKEKASLNDLIYNVGTESTMGAAPWLYQGSYIHNNNFKAETSGDIGAVFITRSSLINFTGKDNGTDEPWIPHEKRIPATGTPVVVTFAPFLEKK